MRKPVYRIEFIEELKCSVFGVQISVPYAKRLRSKITDYRLPITDYRLPITEKHIQQNLNSQDAVHHAL